MVKSCQNVYKLSRVKFLDKEGLILIGGKLTFGSTFFQSRFGCTYIPFVVKKAVSILIAEKPFENSLD